MYLDLEFLLNESELSRNILKPLDLVVINRNFDKILDIEEISKNDPMFRVSKIKEENSKIAIDILRASQMPSLSIQLNYNSFYSDSNEEYNFSQQWENNKNYGFSFVLSIPIFNGFLVKNKIRKEKIYYSQAKIKTNIEKNVIERILKQANVDFESLNNKVLSSELAVEYSKKTYDADLVKFEFGKLSLSDLLISQKIYYQNQSELIKYKYEYLYSKALLGFYNNNVFIFN
jgi:outer membrane protein